MPAITNKIDFLVEQKNNGQRNILAAAGVRRQMRLTKHPSMVKSSVNAANASRLICAFNLLEK